MQLHTTNGSGQMVPYRIPSMPLTKVSHADVNIFEEGMV